MGLYTDLNTALKTPLVTAALVHPVMYPNMPASTVNTDGTFLKLSVLHNTPEAAELGTNCEKFTGLIQIDVYTPAEGGDGPATKICDDLRAIYPRGRLMDTTRVLSSGISTSGPDNVFGAKLRTVYTVTFEYYGLG